MTRFAERVYTSIFCSELLIVLRSFYTLNLPMFLMMVSIGSVSIWSAWFILALSQTVNIDKFYKSWLFSKYIIPITFTEVIFVRLVIALDTEHSIGIGFYRKLCFRRNWTADVSGRILLHNCFILWVLPGFRLSKSISSYG